MVSVSINSSMMTKNERIIHRLLLAAVIISFVSIFVVMFGIMIFCGGHIPDWFQGFTNVAVTILLVSFGLLFVFSIIISIKSGVRTIRRMAGKSDDIDRDRVYGRTALAGPGGRYVTVELRSSADNVCNFYLDGEYLGEMSGERDVPSGLHKVCVKYAGDRTIFEENVNFDGHVSFTVVMTDGGAEVKVECL